MRRWKRGKHFGFFYISKPKSRNANKIEFLFPRRPVQVNTNGDAHAMRKEENILSKQFIDLEEERIIANELSWLTLTLFARRFGGVVVLIYALVVIIETISDLSCHDISSSNSMLAWNLCHGRKTNILSNASLCSHVKQNKRQKLNFKPTDCSPIIGHINQPFI